MIDGKTIKSLYDDKPTLLEWLKRVEEQLEELKKVANFDTLTAYNVEVNQKLNAQNIHAGKGEIDELFVKDNPVSKAVYVHQITWDYIGEKVTKRYLSTNPRPYKSMADIFAHKNDTNLNASEVANKSSESVVLNFSSTGDILNAVGINVGSGQPTMYAMSSSGLNNNFLKDEVIGGWGA